MWLGATYQAGRQAGLSASWGSFQRRKAFQLWMVDVGQDRLDFSLGPSPSASKVQASWILFSWVCPPSLDPSEIGRVANVYTGTPAQMKAEVPGILKVKNRVF